MKRPISPLSIVRIKKLWPHARKEKREVGQLLRVGYYSPQDGLDCIWLVDDAGNYSWTIDHDFLDKHFEVVERSKERSLYGRVRPKLKPIKKAAGQTGPANLSALGG
jgi:hypothetical protein